jgi:hypothetical protein
MFEAPHTKPICPIKSGLGSQLGDKHRANPETFTPVTSAPHSLLKSLPFLAVFTTFPEIIARSFLVVKENHRIFGDADE